MEEVAAVAHVLTQTGIFAAIEDHVQFARARFGKYDTIDFVIVLFGYALSGEPTITSFYERLIPFQQDYLDLFDRHDLPSRSALSRFLASLDQTTVEALRVQFQNDLFQRGKAFSNPGGLLDRSGQHAVVIDVDGTRAVARQRALPQLPTLPAPHRRFGLVAAPGYTGRNRGEVVRTRTTILQAHTHQFLGTFGGPGNGDYREELKRACVVAVNYATTHCLLPSQVLIRLDGAYGDKWVLSEVLSTGLGLIGRSRDYTFLDRAEVKAVLAGPAVCQCTHPESGAERSLYDCPQIRLAKGGPDVRLLIATHPATLHHPKIGKLRDGTVYELFVSTLAPRAFTVKDVLDLYLHRGSFETVLADEDQEQNTDRWVSHSACGQEFWQILNQWVWNLRLELGQNVSATPIRTTAFAPTSVPVLASTNEPVAPVVYGPPQWAQQSFTGHFPGSAFTLRPDGILLCPDGHQMSQQELRPERNGSLRIYYVAHLGDCRPCLLREQCLENPLSVNPRRVSAVYWPSSPSPMLGPPEPPADGSILWYDWPRCQIRRHWIKIVRSQSVEVTSSPALTSDQVGGEASQIITRAERAHWRLSWQQRLSRNARPATSPSVTVTLHGLPASFARTYGFDLLETA